MRLKVFTISALGLALALPVGLTGVGARAARAQSPDIYGVQHQDGRWDQAPGDYRDAQRQGFHDGMEAARRDFERHRRKDADDHEMYKHPRVDRNLRNEYREGFRHGYERAQQHMMSDHRDHDHDDHP